MALWHLSLTPRLMPECDVFLTNHGVEVGKPFGALDHVARTIGIHEPRVFQASILRSRVVIEILAVAAHRIICKGHGTKASSGVDDEAESIALVLNTPLELLVAQRRDRLVRVVVKGSQGGEEGTFHDLCLLSRMPLCQLE